MTTLALALIGVLVYWSLEGRRLRIARRAVPIRIHVNGSRGKSSVTRLIAAALRSAGVRTLAKTTGTRARLITPDGVEEPVVRLGSPNIREQVEILDRARRERAEAIVLECMAVRPDLQRTTEESILRATVGVLTNVRRDHLDVMGPTEEDAAVAMASVVPRRGVAIAGGARHHGLLESVAAARGSELRVSDRATIPPGAMEGFAYYEHAENVACALEVTRHLGIDDARAIAGMQAVEPDPGACVSGRLRRGDSTIRFFNIFAANDPESTVEMWRSLGLDQNDGSAVVALLNLRSDRGERSLQFVDVLGHSLRAHRYLLIGDAPRGVVRRFRQSLGEKLVDLSGHGAGTVLDAVAAVGPSVRAAGIGNIGGVGHQVLRLAFAAEPESIDSEEMST